MRPFRAAALAATLPVLATLLTGCGGDDPPAGADRRRADSINATVGGIRLLAVRIETPEDVVHVEGGNVGLFLTLANSGEAADTLTAVSTVDAEQVILRDGTAPPAGPMDVELPPGGVVSMQYPGGPHLELVGLRRDVGGGRFMPVTFRFRKAGATTVNVFVQGFAHPTVAPLRSATP